MRGQELAALDVEVQVVDGDRVAVPLGHPTDPHVDRIRLRLRGIGRGEGGRAPEPCHHVSAPAMAASVGAIFTAFPVDAEFRMASQISAAR